MAISRLRDHLSKVKGPEISGPFFVTIKQPGLLLQLFGMFFPAMAFKKHRGLQRIDIKDRDTAASLQLFGLHSAGRESTDNARKCAAIKAGDRANRQFYCREVKARVAMLGDHAEILNDTEIRDIHARGGVCLGIKLDLRETAGLKCEVGCLVR